MPSAPEPCLAAALRVHVRRRPLVRPFGRGAVGVFAAAAALLVSDRASAVLPIAGMSLVARNGDLVAFSYRVGVVPDALWGPGDAPHLAALVEAGIGLGGATVGVGPALCWNASHPYGAHTLSAQAKFFRPWLLSPWERRVHGGVETAFGFAIFHVTTALYTEDMTAPSSGWRLQIGAGLRMFF